VIVNRRDWRAHWSAYRTVRAQRRTSREHADAAIVRAWLDVKPSTPRGTALPLSGRRLRRSMARLIADIDMRPRPEALDMVRAACEGRTAGCPEHGIQVVDDGRPRCGCPIEEMARD
jgi:hypothetical protein